MKVGMLLGRSPIWGGTYQYEVGVLQCLKQYGGKSGHRFVVFGAQFHFEPLDFAAPHLSYVQLTGSASASTLKGSSALLHRLKSSPPYRLVRKITTPFGFFSKNTPSSEPYVERLQSAVAGENIHVMFYPGTYGECLKVETPYILSVFDVQHRLQPEFPEVSFGGLWDQRESLYARAIPRALAVVVDSDVGKEDVIRFYRVPAERVKVLPYLPARCLWPVPAGNDTSEVLEKYGIPSGYLFYPAQFWPHKNHAGLLRAVSLLHQRHNVELPLVLVGADKGNLDYLREMVRELDLTSQVYFLGFVPDGDMEALYRNALALVMPTFFGPTNIPVYEAFALECPVITSDIRGIREQAGDAGILVDPKSPEQICHGIYRLYTDPSLRQTLIQKGKERMLRWGPKDYAQGLLEILDGFEPVRSCWRV